MNNNRKPNSNRTHPNKRIPYRSNTPNPKGRSSVQNGKMTIINTSTDDISKLRNTIVNSLNTDYRLKLRKLSNQERTNYIEKLRNYWEKIIQRDMPNLSQKNRNNIISYMIEFINLSIKNGYITDDNIIDVFTQLAQGIQNIKPSRSAKYFGTWSR